MKNKKTVIQIGTADGNDAVFRYLKTNGFNNYNVFFIEPNIYSKPLIEDRYKELNNKKIFSIAITEHDGDIDMFFDKDYETGSSYHSSAKGNILDSDGETHTFPEFFGQTKDNITTLKVPCLKLNTFINKYLEPNTEIEHIFIDAEGYDCDIVSGIDFTNLKVNNITFEYLHAGGVNGGMDKKEFEEAVNNLQDNGFLLLDVETEEEENHTYIKNWKEEGKYDVTFTHERVIPKNKEENYVKVKFIKK